MKKIVSESLVEFRRSRLDEGFMDTARNVMSKVSSGIKGMLKKIGKFFYPEFNGEVMQNITVPVNVGIMVKNGMLKPAIGYRADSEDIKLSPELSSLNSQNFVNRYVEQDKEFDRLEAQAVDKWVDDMIRNENSPKPEIRESYLRKTRKNVINESKVFEKEIALQHPLKDSNIPNIGMEALIMNIEAVIDNPLEAPLFIWGAPGIGKTQIVKSLVKASGGRMIDLQLSKMRNDDFTLPYLGKVTVNKPTNLDKPKEIGDNYKDEETESFEQTYAMDAPKKWIPGYIPTGDANTDQWLNDQANGANGGMIFLDEINRATPDVINTMLKLVDERIISNVVMGDKWAIIAAANRVGDDPLIQAQDWSNILSNRFAPIVNYVPTFEDWKPWALENNINEHIMTFLEFNTEYFYMWDTKSEVNATPRGWHRVSRYIDKVEASATKRGRVMSSRARKDCFQIALGTKLGTEFVQFMNVLERYSLEDINMVLKDPNKAPVLDKTSSIETSAFITAVVKRTQERQKELTAIEWENYCTFLTRLDKAPLASKALQLMVKYHPYLNKGMGDIKLKDGASAEQMEMNKKYAKGIEIFMEKYHSFF